MPDFKADSTRDPAGAMAPTREPVPSPATVDVRQPVIPEAESMSQISVPRAAYVLQYARDLATKAGR